MINYKIGQNIFFFVSKKSLSYLNLGFRAYLGTTPFSPQKSLAYRESPAHVGQ